MKNKNWENTAIQSRKITWTSSKQTYFTARAVVDRELVDDFVGLTILLMFSLKRTKSGLILSRDKRS